MEHLSAIKFQFWKLQISSVPKPLLQGKVDKLIPRRKTFPVMSTKQISDSSSAFSLPAEQCTLCYRTLVFLPKSRPLHY